MWLAVELILLIAFYISSSGQKKEYALLRVLGLSRKQLIGMIIKESLLITLAGFVVGGFLSAITVFPFGRYLANNLRFAYITPTVFETVLIFFFGLAASVLSGILASSIPIARICKLDEYSALREEE